MTNKFLTITNIAITLPVIAGIILLSAGFPHAANAAALTGLKDTMSSLKVGDNSTHKLEFVTPTSITLGSSSSTIITFPSASGFDFSGKTIAGITVALNVASAVAVQASPAAANVWGAVLSGTNNTVLTLTPPLVSGSTAINPGDKITVNIPSTNAKNPLTASGYNITLTGTTNNTGNVLVNILTDDQVLVSAVVTQTLSFNISSPTIGFGPLTPGTPKYANAAGTGVGADAQAHTIVVATNAAGGYNLTYAGPTLTYGANTISAIGAAATAPNAGQEQFGLRAIATGGSGAVQTPYTTTNQYAFVAGTAQTLALATGPSDATTYDLRYIANAISTTEAGSYSTALTYVATANY